MRTVMGTRPRMPATTFWLLMVALVVLGSLGTVAALVALGVVELPFLKERAQGPSYEGLVAIPVSARAIPLHTRVTRDDLLDPKTGTLKVIRLRPDQVRPTMLLRLEEILGRVVKRDKSAGYVFTEEDFHPRGTRPGQSAGVPPGMRAMALHTDKLHGAVQGLKTGDLIDVVATIQAESKSAPARPAPVQLITGMTAPPPPPHPLQRAHVKVVVEGGIVLTPLAAPPTKKSPGDDPKARKYHEVVVAVHAEEVPQLEAALARSARLTVLARTGQPAEVGSETRVPGLEPPPPPPPLTPTTVIELYRGMKREVVGFYGNSGPYLLTAPAPTKKGKAKR
ncbi:MAG: RcpC/CpaB family pilus assembly protein [Gemmataceae bacterium]|nr:RcpC/CpaB family pilus assembly protein [Gemmataceae bacterium]